MLQIYVGAVGHISGLVIKDQTLWGPGEGDEVIHGGCCHAPVHVLTVGTQHHHLIILSALCAEGYFDLS